jgi:hypothetical protein
MLTQQAGCSAHFTLLLTPALACFVAAQERGGDSAHAVVAAQNAQVSNKFAPREMDAVQVED